MKALFITLSLFIGSIPALATDHTIAQAEADAANVKTLVLNGTSNESARLLKLAPKLIALETVVFEGITTDQTASNLVSSVAACNKVRTINFRHCALAMLPSNLRMLTQVTSFEAENTTVADGEQFYNGIADMPNVRKVTVTGGNFRSLPKSFSRLRVMDNINLVNTDLQLSSGYDLNTKTPDELRSIETVQFGFGDDALHLNYTCFNAQAGKSHVQMFRDVLQGAYRESHVFYSPANTRAFMKPHPLVKPPVKGVDITPDVYTVNAMTGSIVEYGSGTKISIPSMAFEDENGVPVQGRVDITYREFRDPVDIMLSGIPMKYDSAGSGGDFKSAGMFEMNASQNGIEVFLRPDKKIDMKFAVTDTAASYDFYRLDEQKGWVYLTDPGKAETEVRTTVPNTRQPAEDIIPENMIQAQTKPIGLLQGKPADPNLVQLKDSLQPVADDPSWSKAVYYYTFDAAKCGVRNWIKDTTPFVERYEDTCYFGITRQVKFTEKTTWDTKRSKSSHLYFRKRGSGKDYTLISLEHITNANGSNPELSAYSGYFWKLDTKMSTKQISQKYGKKSGINDCRIMEEGGGYVIELKYHWGYERVAAEPVKMDRNNNPVSLTDGQKDRMYADYTKRLNRREITMNRGNEKQKQNQLNRIQRAHSDSIRVWKRDKKHMSQKEKDMDFPTWNAYVKRMNNRVVNSIGAGQTIGESVAFQALQVAGMGIYNCDQVRRMQKPKEFVVNSVKVAGAVIIPVCVFVVDRVSKMVFRYGGVWSFENRKVEQGIGATYDQAGTNQLLATDKAGNLYQVSEQQFFDQTSQGVREIDFDAVQLNNGGEITPETVREAVFGPEEQQ